MIEVEIYSLSVGGGGSFRNYVTSEGETKSHPLPSPHDKSSHHDSHRHHHTAATSRNRHPCGECCVCRRFNTLGDCSFHAKPAVGVDAAATAITAITTTGSSHHGLYQLSPLRRRCKRQTHDESGGPRDCGGVNARPPRKSLGAIPGISGGRAERRYQWGQTEALQKG